MAVASATTASEEAAASVLFLIPSEARPSPFGATSPEPSPDWRRVVEHLSRRITFFDERIAPRIMTEADLLAGGGDSTAGGGGGGGVYGDAHVVVAVGLQGAADTAAAITRGFTSSTSSSSSEGGGSANGGGGSGDGAAVAFLATGCSPEVQRLQFAGPYRDLRRSGPLQSALQEAAAVAAPWSGAGAGKRLLEQADTLFRRHSSEDFMYALFFVLHAVRAEREERESRERITWRKRPVIDRSRSTSYPHQTLVDRTNQSTNSGMNERMNE